MEITAGSNYFDAQENMDALQKCVFSFFLQNSGITIVGTVIRRFLAPVAPSSSSKCK